MFTLSTSESKNMLAKFDNIVLMIKVEAINLCSIMA